MILVHLREQLSIFEPFQISGASSATYSKPSGQSDVDHESTERRSIRSNRKLQPAEVAEVVSRYEGGEPIRSLARAFGTHEQTVRAQLRKSGVTLRPLRALTDEQLAEAAELYRAGWSTGRLGRRYDVGATTIRINLRRLGVRMRPRGWEPKT